MNINIIMLAENDMDRTGSNSAAGQKEENDGLFM